ncbi:nicotinate-nucleotide pyrophosphorylase (carboxylating) [Thermosulfidibacter takaii ABI70S6]|uniref:Probable nicotinate-nucleotide pyrophosphorylase [carboxylating] n=1 Tax=Thermosulfidibacter takaii (strain DSM 17441 / JCM 13301 / NBRC 103674 / ABI70S6) TaxID=1298851 RepID=A0A0S3QUR8_THET7|nr:carboxylating nicotinate-nucleotide diphosphorylase [Thermosulfidibacter takaii]BAT72067.1 nicotinate-nucleotide pyrophosphorylase (carboxylating) [Thermosulfidibacter takaii ABI70S6]
MRLHPILYREQLISFLKEDLGHGDITTLSLTFPEEKRTAKIIAKEDLIVAGLPFVKEVFKILDPESRVDVHTLEGQMAFKGQTIAEITAKTEALLMGERTALNLFQRLCGIATLTREMVEKIRGTKAQLVDTRKTTPGLRIFEKYAVRIGGAKNHRMGLYDCAMIKDNHIAAAGSIKKAVEEVRRNAPYPIKIEVEVETLEQLQEAIDAGANIVLLDNMDIETMKEAVKIAKGKVLLEASGGITPDNITQIAQTGVDYISTGFVVHHAVWKDISLKME